MQFLLNSVWEGNQHEGARHLVLSRLTVLFFALGIASTAVAQTGMDLPEADELFHSDPRWLGADGAFSIDLGQGLFTQCLRRHNHCCIADVYLFGQSEPEHHLYMARLSIENFAKGKLSPLQWWSDTGWRTESSKRSSVLSNAGTETSLQRDPGGMGFIEVTDLILTHVANGPDEKVAKDMNLYFPRFVKVELHGLEPAQ